jgi:hypothetical protein
MSNTLRRALAATAAALLAAAVGAIAAPAPVRAGGWAATVLDPTPERMLAGPTYTVGLWVLQHGNHPYIGDLGPVELRLVDARGKQTAFPAAPLTEPAHYAAAIALPHDGTFALVARQGLFADYHIGTVTVPGSLVQGPTVAPLTDEQIEKYWPGAVKPPVLPVDQNRDPFAPVAGPVAAPLDVPIAAAVPVAETRSSSPRLVVLAGVAALLLAGAVLLGRRRFAQPRRGSS